MYELAVCASGVTGLRMSTDNYLREDFKKINGKENDIVKKKKSNFECIIKSDILLREGG